MQASTVTPIHQAEAPVNQRLVDLVNRHTEPHSAVTRTAIPGLTLYRADEPVSCHWGLCEPSLIFFIQGKKLVTFGDQEIEFTPLTYMVNNVHLPVRAGTFEASLDHPYLSAKVTIDRKEVAGLILEFGDRLPAPEKDSDCPTASCGMCRTSMGPDTQQAVGRLLELLDKPEDIAVLAPLARREILYRAMIGELGPRIRKFASDDSRAHRIAEVINLLKERFAEPLRVGELAEQANMSESALFHTFKRVTRMSPLQYQKSLRLHEARRLMLAEGLEAAAASYRVGYESPSQFSREYSRLFGAPPRTDVVKLRGVQAQASA